MIKATTSHGTYYLIDKDNNRAKRIPAHNRGELITDNEWFFYSFWSGAAVGEIMYFSIMDNKFYDWLSTTEVVSVEEVHEDKDRMLHEANHQIMFRSTPDNHFLFCPLAFACGHLERYTHHLCSPGFTWCVDCDRECACMEATDGFS